MKKLFLLMMVCTLSLNLFAQSKEKNALTINSMILVETKDDNTYQGKLLSRTDESLKMETSVGEIEIKTSNIRKCVALDKVKVVDGKVWYENPNATRYLFAPSAFNLKKGEGYYQNTWVFLNQVSYGFTDNFTCGLGTIPIFINPESAKYTPIWFTPKFNFNTKNSKIRASVGTISVFAPFTGEGFSSVGVVYGMGTYGNRDNNISLGLGWGYSASYNNSDIAKRPTLNISGMYRVSRNGYIVGEFWRAKFGQGDANALNFVIASYRHTLKSISVDLGVARASLDGEGGTIPWLGLAIPFGKKF